MFLKKCYTSWLSRVTGVKKHGCSFVMKWMCSRDLTLDKATYAEPGGILSMSNHTTTLSRVIKQGRIGTGLLC